MRVYCRSCLDSGYVCENHPSTPWAGVVVATWACQCGAGMPCPACCNPDPARTATAEGAFVPVRERTDL